MDRRNRKAIGVLAVGGLATATILGLLSSRASASTPAGGGAPAYDQIRAMVGELGLGDDWADFFVALAWNESRGNPEAINDSASEAKGAKKAFERNAGAFVECGRPDSDYTFGSGGLFGMIPTYAALTFKAPQLRCAPPRWIVTNPRASQAAAIGFANGLMQWARYNEAPTFGTLRAMWGNPSRSLEEIAARLPKYEQHARKAGVDPAFLRRRPSDLELTADEAYDVLTRGMAVAA